MPRRAHGTDGLLDKRAAVLHAVSAGATRKS